MAHLLSTLFILDTCKKVRWQTVKTKMKCYMIQYFIMISTVLMIIKKKTFTTEMHNLEMCTCDPLKYKISKSILILSTCMRKLILSTCMRTSIRMKRVNLKTHILNTLWDVKAHTKLMRQHVLQMIFLQKNRTLYLIIHTNASNNCRVCQLSFKNLVTHRITCSSFVRFVV